MSITKLNALTVMIIYWMSNRILSIRVKEHRNPNGISDCTNHELFTGHRMCWEIVTILDTANSELKLRYKQLLHILK